MPFRTIFSTSTNASNSDATGRISLNDVVDHYLRTYIPLRLRMNAANMGSKWGAEGEQKPP